MTSAHAGDAIIIGNRRVDINAIWSLNT